jgi:hypothetical protein
MKMTVFWQKLADISEVLATSIIALMMEAESTFETSVNFYRTTRSNIPEDSHLCSRRRENLKSHLLKFNSIHTFTSYFSKISLRFHQRLRLRSGLVP